MDQRDEHSNSPLELILSHLDGVKSSGNQYQARCPAHDDREASLSVKEGSDGRVLLKCFAGCETQEILSTIGLNFPDLYHKRRGKEGALTPSQDTATLQQPNQVSKTIENSGCDAVSNRSRVACNGCGLEEYSKAKLLPVEFLRAIGLTEISISGIRAVRISYLNQEEQEVAVRFRLSLEKSDGGDNRFRWRSGAHPILYGLWREFKKFGYVVIVEGESDAQTLWLHDLPALGLPGATSWNESRDASLLDDVAIIYIVIEPDTGGEAVQKWLSSSVIRHRVKLINLGGFKDPSELYLSNPSQFKNRFQAAMDAAVPWVDLEAVKQKQEYEKAWKQCEHLATAHSILNLFVIDLRRLGVAGEERTAKLLFLAVVSRYLQRPTSVAIRGPSAGGKSYLVEAVLKFFPQSAFYVLTSMSEHALAYGDESLSHRMLVLIEAAGLASDFASYLIRTLLSEGRIRYETVEKTSEGIKPRLIEREGPTGLIVTTTLPEFHPENETRLLSVTVSDSQAQTAAVLRTLAEDLRNVPDLSHWHSLQIWLDHAEHRVTIPYAKELADGVPPVAVRLRRDFSALLNLIRSHAFLHQAVREKDADGRVVAALEDYAIVRELVSDLISEGVGRTVNDTIRETVVAVESILNKGSSSATVQQLCEVLRLDKSATSRRVKVGIQKGYLVNNQKYKGKPAQIVLGDPLPEDVEILPPPSKLGCCTVADEEEEVDPSPPLSSNLREVRV